MCTAVQRCYGDAVRIDMDKVSCTPPQVRIDVHDGSAIQFGSESLLPSAIAGVFLHHPLIQIPQSMGLDELDRRLWAYGWKNAIDWLEGCLSDVQWANRPSSFRYAASTARQLLT